MTCKTLAAPVILPAFLAGLCLLASGCVETSGYGRDAGRRETELRGLLLPAPTPAPAGVVAVLQSRSGTRLPCNLRTPDAAVAEDIRTLAAKGGVVIVTGAPGPTAFTVTAIREDGKRRRRPAGDDDALNESKGSAWSHITWGGVPVKEDK